MSAPDPGRSWAAGHRVCGCRWSAELRGPEADRARVFAALQTSECASCRFRTLQTVAEAERIVKEGARR